MCTKSIDYHIILQGVFEMSHKLPPKIWDILENFQKICHSRGWKTSQENIVKVKTEYHNLIGTRTAHPSTFKRITSNKKVAIPDGRSYRVVGSDYTAWVFEQKPSKQLVETLAIEPELAKKTAIYDLSKFYCGKPLCMRLNKTRSPVFKEFEKFLKKSYRIKMKPLYEPDVNEPRTFKEKLQKASQG